MITYTCDYCNKEFLHTHSNAKQPGNTLSSRVEICGLCGGNPMLEVRVVFDSGNINVHLCNSCRCNLAKDAIEKLQREGL